MRIAIFLLVAVACALSSIAEAQADKAKEFKGPFLEVGKAGTYVSFPAGPEGKKPSWTITLEEVKRSATKSDYLLAKVTYTAGADCLVSGMSMCGTSARHFAIVMSDGKKVMGSILDISETPKLTSTSLQPGKSQTGYIGFKVPAKSGELKLLFEPYPGQMPPQFGFKVVD